MAFSRNASKHIINWTVGSLMVYLHLTEQKLAT